MIESILITIIGGIGVIVIAKILGLDSNKHQITLNLNSKHRGRIGKKIMISGATMVIIGIIILGNITPNSENETLFKYVSLAFVGYGVIIFLIGKFVKWYQD